MGGVLRRRVQRSLDHLSHLRVRYRSRSTRTILVGQSLEASLHKPPPPFADRVFMHAKAFGDFLALQPFCAQQDHPATIRQRTGRFVPTNLSFEKTTVLIAEDNQIRLPASHHKRSHLSDKNIK
jgi:hypothetical protein